MIKKKKESTQYDVLWKFVGDSDRVIKERKVYKLNVHTVRQPNTPANICFAVVYTYPTLISRASYRFCMRVK